MAKQQWHPTFARLLRPLAEGHYEVKTDVPVGDMPRQADIVLLRRTSRGPLPFRGLWRDLTTWNVLEFKGPTVSPRGGDLDLLAELGLGIHRRLNEERHREGGPPLGPAEVSFWYLANHLGTRLLRAWRRHAGPLEQHGPGVWRCEVLRRPVFLVGGNQLPVEQDSLPLHLIGEGPAETERQMAQFLVERPNLWEEYGGWLAVLHEKAYQGVEVMAKTKRRKFDFNLAPLIEAVGERRVIDALGKKKVIEALGPEDIAEILESDECLEKLSPERRRRLIEKLGGVVPPGAKPPTA